MTCMEFMHACIHSRSGLGVNERYNAFFSDYSLTPLLVQQNYIDAAKVGLFRGRSR